MYSKITKDGQIYSTFVNVGKVYAQLLTVMETQAEILSKLNGTPKSEEETKILSLFQQKLNETADHALKQL